ncbi:hypothetical protein B484DRAFT_482676 [Ochromonadaceae sp. CCMP2298]|nr:hypothetical protein B484DRAFT_482676 [Ochromonadaceae sp. CCMP2298]
MNFLPDKQFWLAWLRDAVNSDAAALRALFDRALASCPHFEVALLFVDTAAALVEQEKMTETELREAFDQTAMLVGCDLLTGSELWRRYRTFELDEHAFLLDAQATPVELQQSKARFVRVFHRQLSLPLAGNEQALAELESKLAEYCVESDAGIIKPEELGRRFSAGREMREARLVFEAPLHSPRYGQADLEQRVQIWRSYIYFERKQEVSRAQRLFERAVLECGESLQLWLEFAEFALHLKNWNLLRSLTSRAVKRHRGSLLLWRTLLGALEQCGAPAAEVEAQLQAAVCSSLPSVEDYLELYLLHLDLCKRAVLKTYAKMAASQSVGAGAGEGVATGAVAVVGAGASADASALEEQLGRLRGVLSCTQAFMQAYCPQWAAGWWRWAKHVSNVQATVHPAVCALEQPGIEGIEPGPLGSWQTGRGTAKRGKNGQEMETPVGASVWEGVLEQFPQSSFLWFEFASWARASGRFDYCRKLWRHITKLSLDVSREQAWGEWLAFEQACGSVAQVGEVLVAAFPTLRAACAEIESAAAVMALAAAAEVVAAASSVHTPVRASSTAALPAVGGSTGKRARGSGEQSAPSLEADTPSARTASATITSDSKDSKDSKGSAGVKAKRVKFNSEEIPPAYATATAAALAPTPTSVPTPAPASESAPVPTPVLSQCTLEIGNLPFAATLQSVLPMLGDKCPGMLGARLLLSKAGQSRGIVEVDFTPEDEGAEGADAFTTSPLLLAANALDGYEYNGRRLRAGPKVERPPKEGGGADGLFARQRQAGSGSTPHMSTVFVAPLVPLATAQDLLRHFAGCGEILAAKVAADKKTGQSKGSGLVQFATQEGRDAALQMRKTRLYAAGAGAEEGCVVDVKPSRFSLVQAPLAAPLSVASAASIDTGNTAGTAGTDQTSNHSGTAKIPPASLLKVSTLSFRPRNISKPKTKLNL